MSLKVLATDPSKSFLFESVSPNLKRLGNSGLNEVVVSLSMNCESKRVEKEKRNSSGNGN